MLILAGKLNNNTENFLFSSKVSCGFPSPADDHIEDKLDLNQHLIQHPAATFFVRACGDSMQGLGIFSGDLLVVDRSITPTDGAVIIAVVDGELTVKSLSIKKDKIYLLPAHLDYKTIEISNTDSLQCWGVVTYSIHDVRKR